MGVTKNNKVYSEQLVAHFELNADPFSEGKGVFFEGAQRLHNLETLRHMSTFGDMVLILTGEKGAGKSTLIKHFAEVCAEDLNIYIADILNSNPKVKSQSVIHRLALSAGLSSVPGETTRQSFSRLLEHFEDQFQKNGLRNVVVFDDADSLPKKELQFYFSYFSQLPKESGVVAIFSGSPALLQVARLSNVDSHEEWLHQVQLRPLVAADVLEYLQLRLEHVGFKGLLELSESQVQHLIDMGKGFPGRINRLFSSVVLEPGSLKLSKKTNSKVPISVFAGMFLLLALSFLFVSYQHGLFEANNGISTNGDVIEEATVEPKAATNYLVEQRAARLEMLDKALKDAKVETLSNQEEAIGQLESLVASAEKTEVNANLSEIELGEKDSAKAVEIDSEPEKVVSIVSKVDEVSSKELELKDVKNEVQAKAEETSKKVSAENRKDPFFKDRAWVQAQSTKAYSAQILGSYNEQTAIQFAHRVSKDVSSIYYLETLHRGRKWYVVFYGVFENKSSAQVAIKKAPKVITSQQPWLRRFDGILASYPK